MRWAAHGPLGLNSPWVELCAFLEIGEPTMAMLCAFLEIGEPMAMLCAFLEMGEPLSLIHI